MATTERLTPEQANRLGDLLHNWRTSANLSQEQAAQRLQISRNYFQLLERGVGQRQSQTPANPRLSTLILFAKAIGTNPPQLVSDIIFGEVGPTVEAAPAQNSSPASSEIEQFD